jgi:hypothetical protein
MIRICGIDEQAYRDCYHIRCHSTAGVPYMKPQSETRETFTPCESTKRGIS